jgi:hemerythrin-like domain-containing protein
VKRHPSLVPLSDDHHRALVLARRLRQFSSTAEATEIESLAADVRREFEMDLERHFRIEERWLLPVLVDRGAGELANRIAKDHARLRTLVGGAWERDTANTLGTLLEKHVRFEEREVFPKAESLLLDDELTAVRDAALGTHDVGANDPNRS